VVVLVVVAAILVAGASTVVYNRVTFGTFNVLGPPSRVDYCGRRYYPGEPPRTDSLAQVTAFLASNRMSGLTRIGSTTSGLPIVANVMSLETRAAYHTNVCTMELWVQTEPDGYVGYGLSGGP
jgi:hypothetical protein